MALLISPTIIKSTNPPTPLPAIFPKIPPISIPSIPNSCAPIPPPKIPITEFQRVPSENFFN